MSTDIFITTRNRQKYLARTLQHIYDRTTSPYTLHIIDDNSTDDTVDFLIAEYKAKRIHHLYLRNERCGAMANLNLAINATFSDVVVFVDDDILCPKVDPDWLSRGLSAMKNNRELGMLALHHPGAKTKGYKVKNEITWCESLGNTFAFVRRQALMALPHEKGKLDKPLQFRCKQIRNARWQIAYLTHTYCYHIGKYSELCNGRYLGKFIEPTSWETLEPIERYRE